MKIQFAGMSAEVPEGWTDESTITYSMPPDSGLQPKMTLNPQSARPSANVTLSWESAPKQTTPEAYLAGRMEQISKALPGFEQKGKGDEGGVPFIEYAIGGSMQLRQIMFAKVVGDRLVCVTGTALDATYDKARPHFVTTAKSLG